MNSDSRQSASDQKASEPAALAKDSRTITDASKTLDDSDAPRAFHAPNAHNAPHIPDHELLTRIGHGSYGEVWLARNVMGTYRAMKIVYRNSFEQSPH